MGVNLSIKDVPEELASRLRERARKNHRSMQGEMLAILETALGSEKRSTPQELLEFVRGLGLADPSESAAMIRADRDGR